MSALSKPAHLHDHVVYRNVCGYPGKIFELVRDYPEQFPSGINWQGVVVVVKHNGTYGLKPDAPALLEYVRAKYGTDYIMCSGCYVEPSSYAQGILGEMCSQVVYPYGF